ncbi:MAG: hypothetical protein JWL79_3800 [Frankiales bacterium]|nr:hypothetical protein [Frankiales bacterium]
MKSTVSEPRPKESPLLCRSTAVCDPASGFARSYLKRLGLSLRQRPVRGRPSCPTVSPLSQATVKQRRDFRAPTALPAAMLAVLVLVPGCRAQTVSCPLVRRPDAVIFDLRAALPAGKPAMTQICADGRCVGHAVDATQPAATKVLSILTDRRNNGEFAAAAGATRAGKTLFSSSVHARLRQTFPFGKGCRGVWRVTIVADGQGQLTTTYASPPG